MELVHVPDILRTTFLEMQSRDDYVGHIDMSRNLISYQVLRMKTVDVSYYKFLYDSIGKKWRWRERMLMPEDELLAILSQPGRTVDVYYVDGNPVGYVELFHEGDSIEIAYFGVRPEYVGKGFGRHLLCFGIETAWAQGARRVWVHTCNMDSPHALDNYLKRGFKVYKVEEKPLPLKYKD